MLEAAFSNAYQAIRSATAAALAPFGLSPEEARILVVLKSPDRLTMGVVAAKTGLLLAALSKAADRLALRGLVRRIGSEDDTRRIYLITTPHGEKLRDAAILAISQAEKGIAERLGTWEMDRLERLLSKLRGETR